MAKSNKKPKDADYDLVIAKVFKDLVKTQGRRDSYSFTKDQIEESMMTLKAKGIVAHIRNIADIKYTYDARRNFPPPIAETGFWGIVGEGKSKYRFERIKQNNLIRIPQDISTLKAQKSKISDATPAMVRAVLGHDEQATMTKLRYNDIISKALNINAFQVQGHERTTVSCGQIEVDEVYVGDRGKKKFIIPISAKGGDKDSLSYSQALNLSLYAREKTRFAEYEPIPLGISRRSDTGITIIRFNAANTLQDVRIEGVFEFELT